MERSEKFGPVQAPLTVAGSKLTFETQRSRLHDEEEAGIRGCLTLLTRVGWEGEVEEEEGRCSGTFSS